MYNIFKMDNFEWLNNIYPLENKPWYKDVVIRKDQVENFNSYESYIEYTGKVNPQLIKGIEYADAYYYYSEITWKELLNNLKRFGEIRQNHSTYSSLVDHIHRYHENDPNKLLFKYGETYITGSGQHRMALAKFLEVPEVEVKVIEFKFSHEKYNKYLIYKRQIKELVENGLLEREENSFLNNNHFSFPPLSVAGKTVFVSEDLMDVFLKRYMEIKSFGWLNEVKVKIESFPESSYSSFFQVNNTKDLSSIIPLLRLHKFRRKRLHQT